MMKTAYIMYNLKDGKFYIWDKESFEKQYFQRKGSYAIIFDVEYDNSNKSFVKVELPRKPYGLDKANEIVKEMLGE